MNRQTINNEELVTPYFKVRDKKTGVEFTWNNGVVTCTSEGYLVVFNILAKGFYGASRIFPEHEAAIDSDGPEFTQEMYYCLALLIYDHKWGKPLLRDGDIVELWRSNLRHEIPKTTDETPRNPDVWRNPSMKGRIAY